MWSLTWRDLVFRRRRFVIAVVGTALVFGMALIMSGMAAGFRVEADRTLDAIGADAWVLPEGVAGPFTAFSTVRAEVVDEVTAIAGVRRADPLIVLRQTIMRGGRPFDINVLGYRPAGVVSPRVVTGRAPSSPGEALVDRSADIRVGERFVAGARPFIAVGHTEGVTYAAGMPVVFVLLADAQALAFEGRPLVTAVVTDGTPRAAPEGFTVMAPEAARDDLVRPLINGIKAIDSTQYLLWVVAAFIIGAVVYLSALERVRDFAVLKAIGASSASLFGSLAFQGMLLSLLAAAMGAGIASALAPLSPLPIVIPAAAFALLPAVALVVGLVASMSGLKKTVDVDPALAFGA